MITTSELHAYQGTVVLRDVDHSRACQIWFVPMSASELERWWIAQATFDSNPNGALDALYIAFGETPPPHNVRDLPGTFLDCDPELWVGLADTRRYHYCSLCCDSDSCLRRPDDSAFTTPGTQAPVALDRALPWTLRAIGPSLLDGYALPLTNDLWRCRAYGELRVQAGILRLLSDVHR